MSLLKENGRKNICFKYCNLFPVIITPPEKKNPHLQKKVSRSGSRLWLKRHWKCRTAPHWERVTQLSGQHTWRIRSNGRLQWYNKGMPLIPRKTRTAKDKNASNYLHSYFIPHPSVNYLKHGKHPLKSILHSFHLSLYRYAHFILVHSESGTTEKNKLMWA